MTRSSRRPKDGPSASTPDTGGPKRPATARRQPEPQVEIEPVDDLDAVYPAPTTTDPARVAVGLPLRQTMDGGEVAVEQAR